MLQVQAKVCPLNPRQKTFDMTAFKCSSLGWIPVCVVLALNSIFAQTFEISYFEDSGAKYGYSEPPPVKIQVNTDTILLAYKSSQTLSFPEGVDTLWLSLISPVQRRVQSPVDLSRAEVDRYRVHLLYSSLNRQLQLSKTDTTTQALSKPISESMDLHPNARSRSSEDVLGCAFLGILIGGGVGAGVGSFWGAQSKTEDESTAPMDVGAILGILLGGILGGTIGGVTGGVACSG
jgi:hypothetical protein